MCVLIGFGAGIVLMLTIFIMVPVAPHLFDKWYDFWIRKQK